MARFFSRLASKLLMPLAYIYLRPVNFCRTCNFVHFDPHSLPFDRLDQEADKAKYGKRQNEHNGNGSVTEDMGRDLCMHRARASSIIPRLRRHEHAILSMRHRSEHFTDLHLSFHHPLRPSICSSLIIHNSLTLCSVRVKRVSWGEHPFK